MCGIFCCIQRTQDGVNLCDEFQTCSSALKNRGPDFFKTESVELANNWHGFFAGSVLWTQGTELTVQPVSDGDILLWNGDIFHGLEQDGPNLKSDTAALFPLLKDPLSILSKLCGPFSFIYWNSDQKKLWFGRDVFGRHSLLWLPYPTKFLIASVGNQSISELKEVPTSGIFAIDLSQNEISVELYPWSHNNIISQDFGLNVTIKHVLEHAIIKDLSGKNWRGLKPRATDLRILKDIKLELGSTLKSILKSDEKIVEKVKQLKVLLYESVKARVRTHPKLCLNCTRSVSPCHHTKIGILFSGGLDSSVIAAVADKFVPNEEPIDLFNVAFDNKRGTNAPYDVPDRLTSRKALDVLIQLSPQRKWNLVEINISSEELAQLRKETISDLVYPLQSVLDDSLGCAVWFAARGKGILDGKQYHSPARIVLLGMGADEIFGGYSRHRRNFASKGWDGLGDELCSEIKNIGHRNLGRDNRVVSDHGRQARTPFLDEQLVSFAQSLAPWERCWLSSEIPPGLGDKLLLRLLAFDLGLDTVASFPKRALQFGSRIANSKEKGHEVCKWLRKT